MWLLYHHFPLWGGEENWKKKAKLVGWDEGSLAEQQMKQTVTTIIKIRRIYKKAKGRHRATPSLPDAQHAPEPQLTSPWPAPPLRTGHDGT